MSYLTVALNEKQLVPIQLKLVIYLIPSQLVGWGKNVVGLKKISFCSLVGQEASYESNVCNFMSFRYFNISAVRLKQYSSRFWHKCNLAPKLTLISFCGVVVYHYFLQTAAQLLHVSEKHCSYWSVTKLIIMLLHVDGILLPQHIIKGFGNMKRGLVFEEVKVLLLRISPW